MSNFFKNLLKRREFNANNCREKQHISIQGRSKTKINEIIALINYKVSSSNYENTVIFTIDKDEEVVYDEVIKYFDNLGFIVLKKQFDELGEQKFLLISWAKEKESRI
jgi:hypothetical protein